jgi:hypothetical protein
MPQGGVPDWLREGTAVLRVNDVDIVFAAPANRTIGMVVASDDGRAGARGFGKTNARAFGYNGFGGRMACADPAMGLSFAYVANGIDRRLRRGDPTRGQHRQPRRALRGLEPETEYEHHDDEYN